MVWDRMRVYMKESGGKRATELFKEVDKDGSGKITDTEFIHALDIMGITGVNKKVAKAILKSADPSGDGKLDYKELATMLKKPRSATMATARRGSSAQRRGSSAGRPNPGSTRLRAPGNGGSGSGAGRGGGSGR